jgi:cytoskeletal protein RodZ
MTPDQKPEWFQIADADNAASPRKISKGLPVMALVAVAAIIGVGAVVAQTQDESPANATETVAPAVVDSNQSSAGSETTATETQISPSDDSSSQSISSTPAKGSQDKESIAPATQMSDPTAAPKDPTAAPKAPSAGGVTNPLDKKPTGGEHEGHEGKQGGEHEGGNDGEGEDD